MTRTSLLTLLVLLAACCSPGRSRPADSGDAVEICPTERPAPHLLPGTRPEHREPGFWISRMEDPDAVILTPEEIAAINVEAYGLGRDVAGLGARFDTLAAEVDPEPLLGQMQKGLARHRERAAEGARVLLDGKRPPETFFDQIERRQRAFEPAAELHLAREITELRCHPTAEGLYEYAGDVDFDLLLCSTLRPGELVRVISRHGGGWLLVRSPYALGWIQGDQLGPRVTEDEARELLGSEEFVVVTSDRAPIWTTPDRREQLMAVYIGLRLPLIDVTEEGLAGVLAPSEAGLRRGWIDAGDVHRGHLPLTRREVVDRAFRQLDDAFGWAGEGGDRDCSRFLMDLFALFGLYLPRNSYFQSRATPIIIETAELRGAERAAALDRALEQGIPLIFMPGHIMLLLGREGDDYYAIHQFSGYRVGCRPGRDVKMAVDRVAVTTLRLGEGSERRSFLERFTRISVIGRPHLVTPEPAVTPAEAETQSDVTPGS